MRWRTQKRKSNNIMLDKKRKKNHYLWNMKRTSKSNKSS